MSVSPATFAYLAQMVRDHSSIVLDETKAYLVECRLGPLVYSEGVRDIDELAFRLRDDRTGPLHRKVLDAMTNNETWFFRDLYPFEALKGAVLPQIISRADAAKSLSIWSAACSSGQEIYSVAMLLRENFPSLLNWKLTLMGTDISEAIMQRARTGVYSQLEVNRGLPALMLAKYFQQAGRDWQLKRIILDMAGFRSLNLSSPFPHMSVSSTSCSCATCSSTFRWMCAAKFWRACGRCCGRAECSFWELPKPRSISTITMSACLSRNHSFTVPSLREAPGSLRNFMQRGCSSPARDIRRGEYPGARAREFRSRDFRLPTRCCAPSDRA